MQPASKALLSGNNLATHHDHHMKHIITKLIAVAVALAATGVAVPEAKAAKLRLEGYGFFEVSNYVRFYAKPPRQGGRFDRFRGGDYYHRAEIGMDYLTNFSNRRSGDMSFEFWAMPYYGATSGIILMTEGLSPIRANRSFPDLRGSGYAIDLDRRRFPELSLWEYTRRGWKFRDVLTFDYQAWL